MLWRVQHFSDGQCTYSLSKDVRCITHINHVSIRMKGSNICTSKTPVFLWTSWNISPLPVLYTVIPSGYVPFWLSGAKRCGIWLTLPLVRWHIRAHIKVRCWAGWVTEEHSEHPPSIATADNKEALNVLWDSVKFHREKCTFCTDVKSVFCLCVPVRWNYSRLMFGFLRPIPISVFWEFNNIFSDLFYF